MLYYYYYYYYTTLLNLASCYRNQLSEKDDDQQ